MQILHEKKVTQTRLSIKYSKGHKSNVCGGENSWKNIRLVAGPQIAGKNLG